MDYILGGIRLQTKNETEKNGKIQVDMIMDKQVVDTFRIAKDVTPKEQVEQISLIVLASYPSLRNTTGFKYKS